MIHNYLKNFSFSSILNLMRFSGMNSNNSLFSSAAGSSRSRNFSANPQLLDLNVGPGQIVIAGNWGGHYMTMIKPDQQWLECTFTGTSVMGTESVPNVTTTGDSSHSDTESRMNTPAREKAVTTTDSQSTRLSLHEGYKQGFTTIQYGNLPLSPDITNQRSPANVLASIN